ncbi:MAG: ABC transporter permease [Bacilli bacterium]
MVSYVIRRLLGLIPTLFIITVIVFGLMHLMPGNAFQALIGLNPHIKDAAKVIAQREANAGLNLNWPQQYVNWIVNLLHGNLGTSFEFQEPVTTLIGIALPNTVTLAFTAELIILIIGIPVGVFQANRVNKGFDISTSLLAVFMYSIPGFVFALFLIFLFSFTLNWLPSMGTVTAAVPWSGDLGDRLQHLILPAVTLALPSVAYYTRLMRANTLQVLFQDYVRTARAKGLRSARVLFRHVLRNAIIPITTQFGFDIGGLVGGAVILEQIFTWPGMGELTINANLNRDYPVILATTLIFAVMVLIGNLFADILLASMDPRVRYN